MDFYIYKYVQHGQIIYIGKTTNLDKRIKEHTKDKLKNFKGEIYYFKCPHKTAMDSWEYFLINKYHPLYNKSLNEKVNININEPEWTLYMNNTKIINISDYLELTSKNINNHTKSDTTIISGPQKKEIQVFSL